MPQSPVHPHPNPCWNTKCMGTSPWLLVPSLPCDSLLHYGLPPIRKKQSPPVLLPAPRLLDELGNERQRYGCWGACRDGGSTTPSTRSQQWSPHLGAAIQRMINVRIQGGLLHSASVETVDFYSSATPSYRISCACSQVCSRIYICTLCTCKYVVHRWQI